MSVLKMGAAFGALACVSALAVATPVAAQTKVYVKVVVEPQSAQSHVAHSYAAQPYAPQPYAAPMQYVQPAPQAYYAPAPQPVYTQPAYGAPCPQAMAPAPHLHSAHVDRSGVRYNRPRTTIAHVQESPVPQPYYERGTHYVAERPMESRAHSRWR